MKSEKQKQQHKLKKKSTITSHDQAAKIGTELRMATEQMFRLTTKRELWPRIVLIVATTMEYGSRLEVPLR